MKKPHLIILGVLLLIGSAFVWHYKAEAIQNVISDMNLSYRLRKVRRPFTTLAVIIYAGYALVKRLRPLKIHEAVCLGKKKTVARLIKKGGDVNEEDKEGEGATPLHWAIANGYREIAELLLEEGAQIDAKNRNNHTPLHWAVAHNRKEMTAFLLDKGADINAISYSGVTPLHIAAENGYDAIIELLIQKGARPNVESSDGKTPYALAKWYNKKECANLIEMALKTQGFNVK